LSTPSRDTLESAAAPETEGGILSSIGSCISTFIDWISNQFSSLFCCSTSADEAEIAEPPSYTVTLDPDFLTTLLDYQLPVEGDGKMLAITAFNNEVMQCKDISEIDSHRTALEEKLRSYKDFDKLIIKTFFIQKSAKGIRIRLREHTLTKNLDTLKIDVTRTEKGGTLNTPQLTGTKEYRGLIAQGYLNDFSNGAANQDHIEALNTVLNS
jgi:hypothetical protein